MAKTLDEIISRNDYIRLNDSLIDRAKQIAFKVSEKMSDIDLKSLSVNGIKIEIVKVSSHSGFSTEYLAIETQDEYGNMYYHSLEHNSSFYFANDFNCKIHRASSKNFLRFLNSARTILDTLDEIETEKCSAIEKALENIKDI